jgi:alanine racemase
MAVVKADAYGHGAVKVSEVASQEGVDFLGVALLEEACELQDAGIEIPTVILYPESDQRSAEAVTRGFYITVTETGQYYRLRELINDNNHPIRFFVKVETGMNRYGMPSKEVVERIRTRELALESSMQGITTNLADATNGSSELARGQVKSFLDIMESVRHHSENGMYYSLESSGMLWKEKKALGSLVRIGHLLYGLVPGGAKSPDLFPVMSVRSRIAEIHEVNPGDGVGYGFSYLAQRKSRVATIPMGYADGYPWSLSNKGVILVRGKRAPVVGKVCMDAFMVDITDISGCAGGDDVVILGRMDNDSIDAHELGKMAGSFSYEILSRWSKRLPRIYL